MELKNMIYGGKLFPDFCIEKNIPFKEFESRFKRMRNNKKLNNYSDEYLIDYIIRNFYKDKQKTNSPYKCKYYVGELTATEYARKNGMIPGSVKGAIHSGLLKNPNAEVEELAISFVERNKERIRYTYENYPLTEACRKYHLSYTNIMMVFYEEYPNREKMTQEEANQAIKEIVDIFRFVGSRRKKKSKELKYE